MIRGNVENNDMIISIIFIMFQKTKSRDNYTRKNKRDNKKAFFLLS